MLTVLIEVGNGHAPVFILISGEPVPSGNGQLGLFLISSVTSSSLTDTVTASSDSLSTAVVPNPSKFFNQLIIKFSLIKSLCNIIYASLQSVISMSSVVFVIHIQRTVRCYKQSLHLIAIVSLNRIST